MHEKNAPLCGAFFDTRHRGWGRWTEGGGRTLFLKNRVSQYFANLAAHTEKTRAMVSQIDHFDVIVADSEFEALVLENSLIKRHQPHYNILLKDDKGYPYIRLTVGEEYPRFSLANRVADDGARYFGPYGSRGATQGIIDAVRLALRLPSCNRSFPRDIGKSAGGAVQRGGGGSPGRDAPGRRGAAL